jgi:hypothetical protein
VREIRKHGSEGGAAQANAPFLPLSFAGGLRRRGAERIQHSKFKIQNSKFKIESPIAEAGHGTLPPLVVGGAAKPVRLLNFLGSLGDRHLSLDWEICRPGISSCKGAPQFLSKFLPVGLQERLYSCGKR